MEENLRVPPRRRGDPSGRDVGGEDLALGALRAVGVLLPVRPGRVPRHRRALADGAWAARRPTPRRRATKRCSGRSSAARAAAASRGSSRATGPGERHADTARAASRRVAIDVAAAILIAAGRPFLLAQRPAGKVYRGLLGIPRRQARARRSAAREALARELHEELGIEIERCRRRGSRASTTYPHGTVRLHFFRVRRWRASRTAARARRSRGSASDAPSVAPMLPANAPVLAGARAARSSTRSRTPATLGEAAVPRRARSPARGRACGSCSCARRLWCAIGFVRTCARRRWRLVRDAGGILLVNGDESRRSRPVRTGVHLTAAAARRRTPRGRSSRTSAPRSTLAVELEPGRGARARFRGARTGRATPTHPRATDARLGRVRADRARRRRSRCLRSAAWPSADLARVAHGAHGVAMIRGGPGAGSGPRAAPRSLTAHAAARSAALRLLVLLVRRDAVLLGRPRAQVDRLAALASRTAGTGSRAATPPACRSAGRARNASAAHRLQNVSSKSTSCSTVRGRGLGAADARRSGR